MVPGTKYAYPIMNEGGAILALTYLGSILSVPSYNVRILQYAIEGEYALHELRHRFTGDFTVRPGENRIVPEVLEKIKRDWPEDYETLDLFEVRLRWNEVAEEIIRKSKENLEKQLRMIKALLEDPVVHKRKHYYINPEWD